MAIEITKEDRERMTASVREYFEENFDESIGDLKAGFLLDFVLKEIAPTVYNLAVRDAQTYMQERTLDLAVTCFEEEFQFHVQPSSIRRSN